MSTATSALEAPVQVRQPSLLDDDEDVPDGSATTWASAAAAVVKTSSKPNQLHQNRGSNAAAAKDMEDDYEREFSRLTQDDKDDDDDDIFLHRPKPAVASVRSQPALQVQAYAPPANSSSSNATNSSSQMDAHLASDSAIVIAKKFVSGTDFVQAISGRSKQQGASPPPASIQPSTASSTPPQQHTTPPSVQLLWGNSASMPTTPPAAQALPQGYIIATPQPSQHHPPSAPPANAGPPPQYQPPAGLPPNVIQGAPVKAVPLHSGMVVTQQQQPLAHHHHQHHQVMGQGLPKGFGNISAPPFNPAAANMMPTAVIQGATPAQPPPSYASVAGPQPQPGRFYPSGRGRGGHMHHQQQMMHHHSIHQQQQLPPPPPPPPPPPAQAAPAPTAAATGNPNPATPPPLPQEDQATATQPAPASTAAPQPKLSRDAAPFVPGRTPWIAGQPPMVPPPPKTYDPIAGSSQLSKTIPTQVIGTGSISKDPAVGEPKTEAEKAEANKALNWSAKPFRPGGVIGADVRKPPPSFEQAMAQQTGVPVPERADTPPLDAPDHPKSPRETLKVDAESFFAPATPQSKSREDGGNEKKLTVVESKSLFAQLGLQGVRLNMPTCQPSAWYSVEFNGEVCFVPVPFEPQDGHPDLQTQHIHSAIVHPIEAPHVTLNLFYYHCFHCTFSAYCGKRNDRQPDLKLGGVCGDVPALCITHLLWAITGIRIAAIDMFGKNFGRCNLWLEDASQTPTLIKSIDRRLWMAPLCHGYSVVVNDDEAREHLLWYLEGLRKHGPPKVRFPRHMVTAERWTPTFEERYRN